MLSDRQEAGAAGLRISPAAAELVCERLQAVSAELAQQLQQSVLQLVDDAVSSRPWESLESGAGSGLVSGGCRVIGINRIITVYQGPGSFKCVLINVAAADLSSCNLHVVTYM